MKKNLSFKLKKTMSLVLAFMMLTSVLSAMTFANAEENEVTDDIEKTENTFVDVNETDWFYDHVNYMVDKGFMIGVSDGVFASNQPLTRAMLVQILYRINGSPKVEKDPDFCYPLDIDKAAWYADAVLWAYNNEIVAGVSPTTFEPNALITRADFATIIRVYVLNNDDFFVSNRAYVEFKDSESIPVYAQLPVQLLYRSGMATGRPGNIFDPKAPLTRAEAATMLYALNESATSKSSEMLSKYGLTIGYMHYLSKGDILDLSDSREPEDRYFDLSFDRDKENTLELPEITVSAKIECGDQIFDLDFINEEGTLSFKCDPDLTVKASMRKDLLYYPEVTVTIGEESQTYILYLMYNYFD